MPDMHLWYGFLAVNMASSYGRFLVVRSWTSRRQRAFDERHGGEFERPRRRDDHALVVFNTRCLRWLRK